MPTEVERRDRLADKCLDLSKVALEQGDSDPYRRLFSNSYRLLLTNLAAMRLDNPEAFNRVLSVDPSFTQFICDGLDWGGRELLVEFGFEDQVLLLEDPEP